MAYITPESFPVRTRSPKRSPERGPVFSQKPVPEPAPRSPAPGPTAVDSYEFQKNAAIFHGSDSRLNSPSMQQMQFAANAARFHGSTPNPPRQPPAGPPFTPPQQPSEAADMSLSYRANAHNFFGATPPDS